MNRIAALFLFITVAASHAYSQINFNYGNISEEELKLKVCPFDSDAVAAVLADEGYTDNGEGVSLVSFYHMRIKVLKQDGVKYGNVSFIYQSESDGENISDIEGMVINYDDQNGRKDLVLDKKSIFRKKINNHYSEITFALPGVKVGSILEYTYTRTAPHIGWLKDWTFQSDIPVYRSSFSLKVLQNNEVSYLLQYNPKYQLKVEPQKMNGSIFFEMKNLPALTNEPYMDARKDYIQKVIFQTTKYDAGYFGQINFMTKWSEVPKELYSRDDFGRQLKVDIDECDAYIKNATEGKSDYEKMRLIHHYVISNLKWNGIRGVITSDGIRTMWKNKSGSAAEINLFLTSLLQKAGLEVYPMLVSERGNGRINKTHPFIGQFNNVYAAVFLNDKKYYLDGTDPYTPFYLTPYSILNSSAYIVNNKTGGIVDIDEKTMRYRDFVSILGTIQDNGEYSGSVQMMSKDYARAQRLSSLNESKQEEYIQKNILRGIANVKVDSFQASNIEVDTLPLKQSFTYRTAVQTTGDYYFVGLDMFTGFEENPFIVNNRFSSVNLGYNRSLALNCALHIPPNMKIDALPKNIKLLNSDQSVVFSRELFTDEKTNMIMARIKVEINKSSFSVDEYADLKEFYKKMIDMMNEQIVLKKS